MKLLEVVGIKEFIYKKLLEVVSIKMGSSMLRKICHGGNYFRRGTSLYFMNMLSPV
jgi:hypothetical protein